MVLGWAPWLLDLAYRTTFLTVGEAKCFQLNEISRNLKAIDGMIHCGAVLSALGSQLYRKLLVASEVYRQQQEMYDTDSRRIDDRIVNLSKPHVGLPEKWKIASAAVDLSC